MNKNTYIVLTAAIAASIILVSVNYETTKLLLMSHTWVLPWTK